MTKGRGFGAAMGLCCVFLGMCLKPGASVAEDRGGMPPEFVWHDVTGIKWRFVGNAKIVGDELVCEATEASRNAYAVGSCDMSEYDGKPMQMHVVASTESVTRSRKGYLGFRFLLSYLDIEKGGHRVWPNGGALYGDNPPAEVAWRDINAKTRGKCEVQLGLLDCTGRAVFNLKTLQARWTSPLVPKVNTGYKVKYPKRVTNAPRGRGFMLGEMDEAAWDELKSWGVNLVRHQIIVRGTGPATNRAVYTRGYLENFDRKLDELERNLAAARACGIRVCIDQHSWPGGGCDAGDPAELRGDSRMFHDPFYAQFFIDCWIRLVKRVAPYRDAIYGYDLINEARHNSPALPGCDIVSLQQRCAKAIREVDPDTTIIVEPMYGSSDWFRSLSAIDLDNVIYSTHFYTPHDYTHQGILTPPERVERWPDPKKGWNRDFLRRQLQSVVDFQKEHDAKIYVGEFSAISWAPNAEGYIRDCIEIFEELGWDWTYHAYREFGGWSVQHEPLSRGKDAKYRRSESNPRMAVLKKGLAGGFAPCAAEDGDAAKSAGTDRDVQAVVDANVGGTAVLPPGRYEMAKTVLLPSHTRLVLGGCTLRMKDGVMVPMFRNIVDANGDAADITVDGCGSCVLDGGEPNGLNEFTSRRNGLPSVRENLTMSFSGVDGFSVRNLTVKDQRWWAMAFVECCNGSISNIEFRLTRHDLDSRAQWRNQDGIDLRVGCHDISISDIRGETGDDMIALTALSEPSCRPGRERDIRNISIRRVRGRTNQCALIRLLSHFGQPVHDIDIEDVVEDSVPGRDNQTQMAIRIGDRLPGYYKRDPANAQKFGDIRDIRINGLMTRALTAVHTDDSVKNLSVRNVRLFGDGGSVWTAGAFGISVLPFIYIPEREDEVRASTLLAKKRGDAPRFENVSFEDVSVESSPHCGEAVFRFNNAHMENCRVGNVRIPESRRRVEDIGCEASGEVAWR